MESLIIAIITLVITFYTGAVVEVETDGEITKSINYTVDVNCTKD